MGIIRRTTSHTFLISTSTTSTTATTTLYISTPTTTTTRTGTGTGRKTRIRRVGGNEWRKIIKLQVTGKEVIGIYIYSDSRRGADVEMEKM